MKGRFPDQKRPLDPNHTFLDIHRTPADKGMDARMEEKEPVANPLPFEWPRDAYEILSTSLREERTLDTTWEPFLDEAGNPLTLAKEPIALEERTLSLVPWYVSSDNLPFRYVKDPEGRGLSFPSLSKDGTLVAHRSDGTLFLQKKNGVVKIISSKKPFNLAFAPIISPDGDLLIQAHNGIIRYEKGGASTILYDPRETEYPLSCASYAPHGELLACTSEGTILLYRKDGTTTILKDPEERSSLSNPSMTEDGTLVARRSGGSLLLRSPDGSTKILHNTDNSIFLRPTITEDGTIVVQKSTDATTLLRAPDGTMTALKCPSTRHVLSQPRIAPDNTFLAQMRNGDILIALPIQDLPQQSSSLSHTTPRRAF